MKRIRMIMMRVWLSPRSHRLPEMTRTAVAVAVGSGGGGGGAAVEVEEEDANLLQDRSQ
jgi:hypothetical protein